MQQVSTGEAPSFDAVADALVYTTLQELATRISHRNTGQLLDDPAGRAVMIRVATDENLHHLFYRDVATEALARHPSEMVLAMERVVRSFAMPGTGIADFSRQARIIAEAGVYDFGVHYHQILVPIVLQRWDVENLDGLTSEAATARDALVAYIARIGKAAARSERRRERQAEKVAARS
jgi:acyl-[acyl-carrier-protein] desaturase